MDISSVGLLVCLPLNPTSLAIRENKGVDRCSVCFFFAPTASTNDWSLGLEECNMAAATAWSLATMSSTLIVASDVFSGIDPVRNTQPESRYTSVVAKSSFNIPGTGNCVTLLAYNGQSSAYWVDVSVGRSMDVLGCIALFLGETRWSVSLGVDVSVSLAVVLSGLDGDNSSTGKPDTLALPPSANSFATMFSISSDDNGRDASGLATLYAFVVPSSLTTSTYAYGCRHATSL